MPKHVSNKDSRSSVSKSTVTKLTSASDSHNRDLAALMAPVDIDTKRKVSMTYATDADGHPLGLPLDLFLFSDSVQKGPAEAPSNPLTEFSTQYTQPDIKLYPQYECGKMVGNVPLTSEFHMESNRERAGTFDDGLDDEDLTAADGIVRKKKTPAVKRRSIIYDNIRTTKGEFTFPYRTYRPKVQVAYQVAAGQVPQAVVVERLHRMYKKTDINLVLQTLGIEPADLIPPPNYSETNERFYQEMMFRNRIRVNGVFKKDFILNGGARTDEDEHSHHLHGVKRSESVSYHTSSYAESEATSSSESVSSNSEGTQEEEVHHRHHHHQQHDTVHPFIKSKSPFGVMFPLNCFDNIEFDIRTPGDWMGLGWDPKERRFYPLPAKAFLPLPGSPAKKKSQALSEIVVDQLLTATPRLKKFLSWLLRERYHRTVKLFGVDPTKLKYSPTEMELSLHARLGSTVPSLFKASSGFIMGHKQNENRRTSGPEGGLQGTSRETSILTLLSLQGELEGENSSTDSSSEAMTKMPEDIIDAGGKKLPLYNIIFKKRVERRPDEEGSDDGDDMFQRRAVEEVKRSESLLTDVFSDMDSLTIMGTEVVTKTEGYADGEETEAEEIEEDTEDIDYYSGLPSRNYLFGDYGPVRPTSPDTDNLTEGHEKYVFDYDKMKKVHVYDWKWVDVAVFDYNQATDRYYVRSIYPPVIHAWVDKVYLCFDGEDPNRHGQRIRDAVIRRFEMENIMRYNLYIDCLPVDDMPSIDPKVMDIIVSKSVSAPRLKFTEESLSKAKKEIDLEYKRTIAKSKFEYVTEKHHKMYKPWVNIPEEHVEADPSKEYKKLQDRVLTHQNFQYKVKKIQKLSVIYQKEPFEAFKRINEICLEAKQKVLIIIDDLEPLHLDDWDKRQTENIAEVRLYLEQEWNQMVLETLQAHLGKIPQSWYNLKETNYDVFIMSKLSNYLNLIKMYMESTLKSIVIDSLEKFITRVQEVSKACDLTKKFAWNEDDIITSLYPTPKEMSQIWVLELYMDSDCPKYSQLLGNFSKVGGDIFGRAIKAIKDLPSLLPQIMPQMQFASHGCLSSPEEDEPFFALMKAELQRYIKRSLLPVDSYVQLFKKYMDIWNLDIPNFIREWEAENHSAQEVRKLVEHHMQHAEQLEKEIPHEINITGFKIIVEVVREGILKKKRNLFNSILECYALKLKGIILKVREDYAEIEKKLNTRSDDIEEVMDLKSYVEAVPSLVNRLEELTNAVIKDYEVFDRFMYQVPADDINAKWQAAVYSGKTMRMAKEATKWLDDDYERLLKVQQQDLGALSDQVDSATLAVAGLVGFIELDKASEVSQEVKRIWKTVKDLQDQFDLLNRRQKIFGLPLSNNVALERLVKDIEPFKNLWFTAADWLKVQETVFSGTLDKVDIDVLIKVITEGGKVIGRCIKYFSGADQIQQIASTIKYQIDEFKPLVPLIGTLKNQGMRQRHWEAMSDVCGFPIVAKGTQNFKKLLEQGIQNFVQEITEIGDLATKEHSIEVALDKMAFGITLHTIKLAQDPATKLPVISLSEKAMANITEYIEQTDLILRDPYNKPFEERLSQWDRKIKLAKENMEMWFENQAEWVSIEPMFKAPDIQTRLPVEYKLFEKMQRIWRRLIRLARDNSDLIELASDTTVIASIHQFDDLVHKLKRAMAEHMKPKNSDSDSDD